MTFNQNRDNRAIADGELSLSEVSDWIERHVRERDPSIALRVDALRRDRVKPEDP